jgi:cation diffusion facilitator CzcD-associated flavoprotein CzcO
MTGHARKLDILVIGAGQAGLALGFHLKKTPADRLCSPGSAKTPRT